MRSLAQAQEVAYRYPQNDRGLAPLSLRVDAGESVLITGPSGCGKSTLARCLGGLIPHLYRGTLSGKVWIDGLRTEETPLWRLAERAGMVFQNPAAQMLTTSVEEEIVFGLENLGLPRREIGQRMEETLDRFGLQVLRHRSPQTLSGGEQQKVALAAITARRPPLLILDEPLSMLDGGAVASLVEHVHHLTHSGTSAVICEHRSELLQDLPQRRRVRLGNAFSAALSPPGRPPFADYTTPFTLTAEQVSIALGNRLVLRDVAFTVPSGQVAAIVGRNGVGKTTLLRALAGLQEHDGVISVDERRPELGLVFQNPDLQLFNPTVREEILYRVEEPDMALYDWSIQALGLTTYESTPPLLLSEGEKKRVALATVLMHRARHGILLDEPSLGQDRAHKAMLIRLCRALAESGKLVIFTTHDLTLAAQADRLLLLNPQGFVADGAPKVVLQDRAAWSQAGLPAPDERVLAAEVEA